MTRPVFRTGPGEALDLVERWISIPALRELVEADGGTWPTGSTVDVVRDLEAFSTIWNKRGGQSRLMFKEDIEPRDDEHARQVYRAAQELGLIDSSPPTLSEVDHLLILGGLATGVEPRVRYAAQLISSDTVSTGSVAALGSFRLLDDREQEAAAHYAPGAVFEIDLISGMLAEVFNDRKLRADRILGNPQSDPAHAQWIREFNGTPSILVYAAASSEPALRPANTADTYHQFARDVSLRRGLRILVVTSSIYRPFQHLDAVRVLSSYGVTIETVGVPLNTRSPNQPPAAYLQEVRSAIRSAALLLHTLTVRSDHRFEH